MEKNKRKHGSSVKFDLIILFFQLIFSMLLVVLTKKILPLKYWLIVILILVVLILLTIFILRKKVGKKRKKGVRALYRIVSLFICIILALGSIAAKKGLSTLDAITGGNTQTQVISVIVPADSSINTIADLQRKVIGYVQEMDIENTNKTLEAIESEEKVDVETQTLKTMDDLQKSLLNGNTDAILLNEAYRGMIEELNNQFESQTKIIYQYHIEQTISLEYSDLTVTKDSFNIFIAGIDTYGPVSTVARSDVNMIVTVNPTAKQILLTSIPRDYYVELASFGAYDKLTHAGVYGVEESISTLENLFDIEIDYYARVNFTSLITMVDALGGITIDNPQAFTSYHTHEYYPKGIIEMDGERALEFARERYGLAEGDRDRVKNQQRVFIAMLDKMMSSAIITNYSNVLNAVSGCFETSMSSSDIQSLIQMQLDDMSSWTIEQVSVDGYGSESSNCYSMPGWSLYVMEPDYSTVNATSQKIKQVEAAEPQKNL